jgi:hypothetical protein
MTKAVWRGLTVIAGIGAMMWAVEAFGVYRAEAPLTDIAQRILLGEEFTDAQLAAIKKDLDERASAEQVRASGLNSVAVIRLHFLESSSKSGSDRLTYSAEVQSAVTAALAQSPVSSFSWLIEYWLGRPQSNASEADLKFLRMSYQTGPNEAWIASRRNPMTLAVFPSLPSELAERAISEFVGLVRSRLYSKAADILAGPGWPIHEQLLARLEGVDEEDRRGFATALASKDIPNVKVPGVEERRFRRF